MPCESHYYSPLNTVPHIRPCGVTFNMYSAEEILKLSVMKIEVPLSFDKLGIVQKGGLYDLRMGPTCSTFDDVCETCGHKSNSCPGHMGHIELAAPVVNPIFISQLLKLLRITCFNCHRIFHTDLLKCTMATELKLIHMGNIEGMEAVDRIYRESTVMKSEKSTTADYVETYLKNKIMDYSKEIFANEDLNTKLTRGSKSICQELVNFCLRRGSSTQACAHCQKRLGMIERVQECFVYRPSAVKKKKKESEKEDKETEIVDDGDDCDDEGLPPLHPTKKTELLVGYLMKHLRMVWEYDAEFLQALFPILHLSKFNHPTDVFFLEIIPVVPPRFRPMSFINKRNATRHSAHLQSLNYERILHLSIALRTLLYAMKSKGEIPEDVQTIVSMTKGESLAMKIRNTCAKLQCSINSLNNDTNRSKTPGVGLQQLLDKKEGLFRRHMMGKRVDFACRSVISPDPNLNVDEIGIPEWFARVLTYPTPVTPWNVQKLRKLILNGPESIPGAFALTLEDGMTKRIDSCLNDRIGVAASLLTPHVKGDFGMPKVVLRHMQTGDILLLNRQPTLHRPSIMAHKARIMKGSKTLRLHYAVCKAYNADFDGDEMNAHFPQNEVARSEAFNIVNVNNQYLSPKDGTPLGGLIQDYMVAGVRLTIRGNFFCRGEYMQLVYSALQSHGRKIRLIPPAIVKPVELWSGKQILSTIVVNITPVGKPPINLNSRAKLSEKMWHNQKSRLHFSKTPVHMCESEVVFRDGELVCGVLDKNHCGASSYSLVHCFYELYGSTAGGQLLSCIGRLFIAYLQMVGYSLGIADILVTKHGNKQRWNIQNNTQISGSKLAADAFRLGPDSEHMEILHHLHMTDSSEDSKMQAEIDATYKSSLDQVTNQINRVCIGEGLEKKFPHNNLQLMVQSGAKGSTVNAMQISSLLGQIELEGKRPPLMISGKSLPCFSAYDMSPRAGGFVDGRFMTGIQPPEYFFHCMAGREGLIDTAVKTSRSGYLQRCLIKLLEGLIVNYDMTVRDSDGCVIQYLYGEDGQDVTKSSFLNIKQYDFLLANRKAIEDDVAMKHVRDKECEKKLKKYKKEVKKQKIRKLGHPYGRSSGFLSYTRSLVGNFDLTPDLLQITKYGRPQIYSSYLTDWRNMDKETKASFEEKHSMEPSVFVFPPHSVLGSVSERVDELIDKYLAERVGTKLTDKEGKAFKRMVYLKTMKSLCDPGEAVGVLAAQSIGEPSTQMTLNTFHFAGRGEMNVTLGIPRLREILMTMSANIKTPMMEIPLNPWLPDKEHVAETLRSRFSRILLHSVIKDVDVTERLEMYPKRQRVWTLRFNFLHPKHYRKDFRISPYEILQFIESRFIRSLLMLLQRKVDSKGWSCISKELISEMNDKNKSEEAEDDPDVPQITSKDDDDSDNDAEGDDGDDATFARQKLRKQEELEYEESEEDNDAAVSEGSVEDMLEDQEEEEQNEDDDSESHQTESVPEETKLNSSQDERIARVMKACGKYGLLGYTYDMKKERWCELTFSLPSIKVEMSSFLKKTSNNPAIATIQSFPGITKAFLHHDTKTGDIVIKTDGVNIPSVMQFSDLLDFKRLYTNSVHDMYRHFGIEAARSTIMKEVANVFAVYGIEVDPRHLSLISDYMTFSGEPRGFSRIVLRDNPSPLQQMSFETTTRFLKEATVSAMTDQLESPSARLVTGRVIRGGTGLVDMFHKLQV